MFFSKRTKRFLFISSDSRRKGTKEDCYPKPLNYVDFRHDSAKRASLDALAAPKVQRGCN